MQSTFLLSAFLAVAIAATAQSPKDTLPGRRPGSVRFHDSLPEVTIKGYQDGGTVRGALRLQKAAVPIVDIVPEESIARSSDLTVADVTRRVGGLSVTTDNAGQSDHTIIRGMDPKYNYTLIDPRFSPLRSASCLHGLQARPTEFRSSECWKQGTR